MAAEQQIRWIWVAFCAQVGLVERLGPTIAESWTAPTLGPVTLGPPTRFSVHLRHGQLRADLEKVRPRLASAYEVDDAIVRDLVRRWVTVELVEHGVADSTDETEPPAIDQPRRRLTPPLRHFPRRRRRGPSGGPRSAR